MLSAGVLIKAMNLEGYTKNEGLVHEKRAYPPRAEIVPFLRWDTEPRAQTLSKSVRDEGVKRGYTHFNASKQEVSLLRGLGKTAQVLTLATVELLASATTVVAGGIVAASGLHFPFAVYTLLSLGAPIPAGVIFTITLSVVGVGLIILGMKRIAAATRRVRSLF